METQQPDYHSYLQGMDADGLHRFLLANDTIRGAMLNGSRMVNKMRSSHELGILETLVLGHAFLGVGLMSAGCKGGERLALHVDCSGPIKGIVAEANAAGKVRGFLKNVPIPVDKPLQDFNLAPFFGAGFLAVTRTLADAKKPFTGTVMLQYGSLAKDLAHYYLTSEQIPTAFSLSVQFDSQGRVAAAGGLFLQAMPNADETLIQTLEDRIVTMPSIGALLAQGLTVQEIIEKHLQEYAPRFIAHRPVAFHCSCNRQQIQQLLAMMPDKELTDMEKNGPFPVEIRCHHCNTRYSFDRDHIKRVIAARSSTNPFK